MPSPSILESCVSLEAVLLSKAASAEGEPTARGVDVSEEGLLRPSPASTSASVGPLPVLLSAATFGGLPGASKEVESVKVATPI